MKPNDELPIEREPKKIFDEDEALAETARGHLTSEEALDLDDSEVDTMGRAAGLPAADGEQLTTVLDELEERDDDRAELEPGGK